MGLERCSGSISSLSLLHRGSAKITAVAQITHARRYHRCNRCPPPGTIDHFHLADPIPAADWKSRYQEGQKLKVCLNFYTELTLCKAA